MRTISSRKSDRVKELVRLHKKADRHAAGLFLAEGPAVVHVALDHDTAHVLEVFVVEEFVDEYAESGVSVTLCTPEVISALSGSQTPQGVVALCRMQDNQSQNILISPGTVIVLDNISDPGNMGTIIRTADAVGAAGILTFGNCVDVYNDKVVRSSAGSLFRVPIAHLADPVGIPENRKIFALTAHSSISMTAVNVSGPDTVLLVGSESHGISPAWDSSGRHITPVAIPMQPGVESLNVAVATAICLYAGYLTKT
jgi:RNA methyltransferase, TrmH family